MKPYNCLAMIDGKVHEGMGCAFSQMWEALHFELGWISSQDYALGWVALHFAWDCGFSTKTFIQ